MKLHQNIFISAQLDARPDDQEQKCLFSSLLKVDKPIYIAVLMMHHNMLKCMIFFAFIIVFHAVHDPHTDLWLIFGSQPSS